MTQTIQHVDPRKTFGQAVAALAEDNEQVVVLSTDSGKSSGFGDFAASQPDRYFEMGIAEQGATAVAAGLATTGRIPVYCAIAPFVTSRNFEFFRNDVGYMGQNVKIVGRNGGFTYSELGSTHHSLEDYALTGSIPGVTVLAPGDAGEMRAACAAMIAHEGPVYMRIGAGSIPDYGEEREFVIGKGYYVTEGPDLTVVTTGYTSTYVRQAVAELREVGVEVDLINMPTVTPIDRDIILESAKKTGAVLTVEEHYEFGGLGSRVAELLAFAGVAKLTKVAVAQENQPSSTCEDLLERNGLDVPGIKQSILDAIENK
ncbi:transketolase family protein [Flaviflexus massiliensis]|uniref:transketolase family protein n=1 Tax=Flaviflexus massiliensis TaxID=1522309 RepID=UPI0006D58D84|nr:transketolase C-terminal domain-containing protein [Flaviflexus massiliensis]